jgi:D-tyrosyl-tRNA(Tyr) deacylase
MRALVQRVTSGSVAVDGEVKGRIGAGLVILLGVKNGDAEADAAYLAEKCAYLRIFADTAGKFNLSCKDVKGDFLVVSQFTLYGNTEKGRRPSFIDAALPEISEPLYEFFISRLRQTGLKVETGVFGAMMSLEIQNDGPVTLMLESKSG